MKISEIITDKYKLRIPPIVYYDLLADVVEAEEEQEPSGDLISRQAAIKSIEERAKRIKNEDTLNGLAGAVGILFELPSVKPQEPQERSEE